MALLPRLCSEICLGCQRDSDTAHLGGSRPHLVR